jgi:hypothetical protein
MEYALLFFEYIWIKKWSYLKQIIICGLLGLAIYYFADSNILIKHSIDFNGNIITALEILMGFSISIFTVFLTIDNKNVREAKKEKLKKGDKVIKLYTEEVSLYDSILIGLAYVIVTQGFLLILNFIYPTFVDIGSTKIRSKLFLAVDVAITVHIIILLMRSILDFYFIITKKKKK